MKLASNCWWWRRVVVLLVLLRKMKAKSRMSCTDPRHYCSKQELVFSEVVDVTTLTAGLAVEFGEGDGNVADHEETVEVF